MSNHFVVSDVTPVVLSRSLKKKKKRGGGGEGGSYFGVLWFLHIRVPGEIKRREVELEEIMSREAELGCESCTSFASGSSSTAVQRTLFL